MLSAKNFWVSGLSLFIASQAFTQSDSYFPILTEPQYKETLKTITYITDDVIRTKTDSDKFIDNDGRFVMAIAYDFISDTPLDSISTLTSPWTTDVTKTYEFSHNTVDNEGHYRFQSNSGTYEGGNIAFPDPNLFRTYREAKLYRTSLLGIVGNRGALMQPRQVTIGQITDTKHREVAHSDSSGPFDFELTSDSTIDYHTRRVFAGIGQVKNLYPGSDIVLVTDEYNALVSITETSYSGVIKNQMVQGSVVTDLEDNFIDSTTTSITWMVKGIGVIRSLAIDGEWLDIILNRPLFNDGSNVVGAVDLETLIPESNYIADTLRASGGNLLNASNTVLTQLNQRIDLWPYDPKFRPRSYSEATSQAELSAPDAMPTAIPFKDGINNLTKYAFNIPLDKAYKIGPNTAAFGFPTMTVNGSTLQLEYTRRTGGEVVYTPKFGDSLDTSQFVEIAASVQISDLSDGFERVTIGQPLNSAMPFAIVEVSLP